MSAARETSNKATVIRLLDAVNTGDPELVSQTIDEVSPTFTLRSMI